MKMYLFAHEFTKKQHRTNDYLEGGEEEGSSDDTKKGRHFYSKKN